MTTSGERPSWADWAPEGQYADGTSTTSGITRPRLNRRALEDSARTWNSIGVVFVILAALGAIAIGIALTPEKVTGRGYFATTEKDSAAGVAIGFGVFIGSLVTILPYFMFSRVMSALADLLPDIASAPAASAPEDSSPSDPVDEVTADVTDYPDVAAAHPVAYQAAWVQLTRREPRPDNPEAWLRELCRRIEAGSPAEAAAERIPLDWT